MKRMVALSLVLLLSIESFAAVVSDNDGSAFITKAEFDSLKNNFQSQIDQFNSSIDSKIDGAIASYLAGVNINKAEIKATIFKDWNEYTIINGSFNNEFKLPKMDLNYVWSHAYEFGSHSYHLMGYLHTNFKNKNKNFMKRNVIDAYRKDGSDNAEEKQLDSTYNIFVWHGYATDWLDEINGLARIYTTGDFGAISTSNFKIRLCKGFSFVISDGYYGTLPTLNSIWKPDFYWYQGASGYNAWIKQNYTQSFDSYSWICSANKYSYEHIGNFRNDSSWEVCLPSWQNTFLTSPNTTLDSASIKAGATQNSLGGYVKDWVAGRTYEVWMPQNLNGAFLNSNTVSGSELHVPFPSIGMAGNLSGFYIQQTKDKINYEFNKKDYTTNPYMLYEGFPLFYATEETEVTWEPVFNDVYGDSALGLSTNEELKIVLAYKTFGNGIDCNNCYITREGDTSATNMIWTTNNKTAKIKFKMPADGWVVAKWWPASLTPEQAAGNSFWYATLDNNQSNKVTFVVAN